MDAPEETRARLHIFCKLPAHEETRSHSVILPARGASIRAGGAPGARGPEIRIRKNRLYTRDNRQTDYNLKDLRCDDSLSAKALQNVEKTKIALIFRQLLKRIIIIVMK